MRILEMTPPLSISGTLSPFGIMLDRDIGTSRLFWCAVDWSLCIICLCIHSEGRPGMSVSPLSGISGLSFDSTLLSPLLFFCLVLLLFIPCLFLPAGRSLGILGVNWVSNVKWWEFWWSVHCDIRNFSCFLKGLLKLKWLLNYGVLKPSQLWLTDND